MSGGITLERLQVIIDAYTKPYQEEMQKIKQKTREATEEVRQRTDAITSKVSSSMKKTGSIITKVLSVVSIAAIVAFGKSCIELGSDLAEVQNVVDVTFGSMSDQVNGFAKNAITQFGLSELAAKKYMGTYGAMAKSFGITGEAGYQMSAAITGLTGDVASFYNLSADEAYTKLKSIFTGETESLKELGVVMTQTALDQYALNNGFGKTTANMTEQEKVMLRYRFVMSSLADASGDFARTSKSWANQVKVLSLQFQSLKASIGQGLINAFTPVIQIINEVLAKLQTLANYFKAFTVALFGDAGGSSETADSVSVAADASGAVADNMNQAAGAAKKMKEYMLGIDELNVLNQEDESGSGGTSSGDTLDFGNLSGNWTDALVPDTSEIIEKICEAFKDGDYKLAGMYISAGITDALRGVDWKSIYQAADNFGIDLASFLSGLISPLLFASLGRTIAGSLNTAMHFLDSFGVTFEWADFGKSIVEGINAFFQTFDFVLAAESLNHLVDGIEEAIRAALENLSWSDILTGIGEFLGTLELDTVAVIIGAFTIKNNVAALLAQTVWKALSKGITLPKLSLSLTNVSLSAVSLPALQVIGTEIIEEVDQFITKNFGESVGNAMGESLLMFTAVGFGAVVGGPLGAAIGLAIGVALDTFVVKGEWITKFWDTISKKLFNFSVTTSLQEDAKKCFNDALSADNFVEFGANILEGIVKGFVSCFTFFLEPIGDLLTWIVEGICSIFGIHSPAAEMEPYGMYILEGLISGFVNTFPEWWDSMNEWYEKYIAPWFTVQKWSELYETIQTEMKRTWDDTVSDWKKGTTDWWNKNVAPWFTIQKWNELYDSIKSQLKLIWSETAGTWQFDLTTWWDEDVSPWFTLEKWIGLYESIKTSMKTTWGETSENWKTDISDWWNEHVSPWFTLEKWTSMMGRVPEAFKNVFKEAVNGGIAIFNRFIDWINDHMRFEWDDIEIAGQTIVEGGSVQLFTVPHIPIFATGGFPEDGLFMANSSELVGQFSNGRTAVANNEQIISGIQRGVTEANAEQNRLLREQNQLLMELLEKDTIIQMDSREVGRTMKSLDKRRGYTLRTT